MASEDFSINFIVSIKLLMARISQEAKLKARKIKHCVEEEGAVRNQLKYLKHILK